MGSPQHVSSGSHLFNTIPQAGLVDAAMPLCYVLGFVVALLVASQVRELAREFPTSVSLYTLGTVYPSPPAPLNLASIIVLVWLLLGTGMLWFLHTRKPEALRRAGQLFVVDETKID